MRRREFISLIGGAVTAWPFAAWGKMRRIGVLMNNAADDPEAQSRLAGFLQGLQEAVGPLAATSPSTCDGRRAMSS
jgi:putative tryptophan/tyrosine transport system substrate-binding protein